MSILHRAGHGEPVQNRRRIRTAVAATTGSVAVAASLTFGGAPAHADIASAGLHYRITTSASLAFDVAGGSYDWGAEVIQWYVNGGDNQNWLLVPTGTKANEYMMQNKNSGLCLSINASDTALYDGAKLIQMPCVSGRAQQWDFEYVYVTGANILEYVIHADADYSYVIDVPGGTVATGTQLEIWHNNYRGLNQVFYLTHLDY
jgi:hypothetical protein